MTGKVILLNGASSSGKTSIATALQAAMDEPFLRYGFDHLRELDALKPPADNARALLAAWRRRARPSAFERMAGLGHS